jgi:cell shape-determining protein MreC
VDSAGGDAFLEVRARPAASLDRLHEVLLVFHQRLVTTPEAPEIGAPDSAPARPEKSP